MSVFSKVQNTYPPRSLFNLSHEKKFTCDMMQLIPVLCQEMVPGDTFKIGNEIVIRMQPLVAPVLHEINAYVHYFFVPYRLLWSSWESFITGGKDGDEVPNLPRWIPVSPAHTAPGTLWDYMGFPSVSALPSAFETECFPVDFPKRAYIEIRNEYYLDENLQNPAPLNTALVNPYNRSWEKDYFTSALPWQQRGVAPALPISGMTTAQFDPIMFSSPMPGTASSIFVDGVSADGHFFLNHDTGNSRQNVIHALNNNTVDLSSASTFDIADLRTAFQIQRWLEKNARGGVRYTEFLQSHFGINPRDDRLQRPEYVGGSKSPIIVSEVLQTSESGTSPQGNMAGHGITADRNFIANYTAKEYGIMMGIFSVMPRTAYQQGISRQWLKQTRYDYYFPEFANLSEQEIQTQELYWSDNEAVNTSTFGYQGRYNEMRYVPNTVHGLFRSDLAHWHLGRTFASAPLLNESFIVGDPSATKRIFAVENEPGLLVSFGNIIRAVRPLPAYPNPGYIDHG